MQNVNKRRTMPLNAVAELVLDDMGGAIASKAAIGSDNSPYLDAAQRADEWRVKLPDTSKHRKQAEFIASPAKRRMIRAGRRGGKTVGVAIIAVKALLAGPRVLCA